MDERMAPTYILSLGPLCLNFHRFDRNLWWRVNRHRKAGWCFFFGLGSIAWWKGQRGLKASILPRSAR